MIVGLAMMATVFVIQVRDVSASDPPSSTWEILPLDRATGINDKGMVVGFIGENIARWIPGGDVGPVLGPYETEVWDGDAIIVPPPTIDNSGAIAGTIRNIRRVKSLSIKEYVLHAGISVRLRVRGPAAVPARRSPWKSWHSVHC